MKWAGWLPVLLIKCEIVFISRSIDRIKEKVFRLDEHGSKGWDLNREEDAFVGGRQWLPFTIF